MKKVQKNGLRTSEECFYLFLGKKSPPGGFRALPSPLAKNHIHNFTDSQECREKSEEKVRGMRTSQFRQVRGVSRGEEEEEKQLTKRTIRETVWKGEEELK